MGVSLWSMAIDPNKTYRRSVGMKGATVVRIHALRGHNLQQRGRSPSFEQIGGKLLDGAVEAECSRLCLNVDLSAAALSASVEGE